MTQEALDPTKAKPKGICDIAFLIDITGSMQPCLDGLVANINSFVETLKQGPDANTEALVKDWRIKVCGYRDAESDGDLWWVDFPFVSNDVESVKANLLSLEARGGADEPESLLDGLWKVASLGSTEKGAEEDPNKWRYRSEAARVIIVFTDATYKATCHIPEAAGANVDDIINKVMSENFYLFAFVPEGQECYYSLGEVNKGELHEIPGVLGDKKMMEDFTADKENFAKIMEALAKTVSKSASTEAL